MKVKGRDNVQNQIVKVILGDISRDKKKKKDKDKKKRKRGKKTGEDLPVAKGGRLVQPPFNRPQSNFLPPPPMAPGPPSAPQKYNTFPGAQPPMSQVGSVFTQNAPLSAYSATPMSISNYSPSTFDNTSTSSRRTGTSFATGSDAMSVSTRTSVAEQRRRPAIQGALALITEDDELADAMGGLSVEAANPVIRQFEQQYQQFIDPVTEVQSGVVDEFDNDADVTADDSVSQAGALLSSTPSQFDASTGTVSTAPLTTGGEGEHGGQKPVSATTVRFSDGTGGGLEGVLPPRKPPKPSTAQRAKRRAPPSTTSTAVKQPAKIMQMLTGETGDDDMDFS
jgi:hypothetical protein